ncbi:M42 family metallopeptidase [Paenactinomyces guangxiensis]|uniref:M42 family metallopeptidase n=1 Tax=Paenactinomyces guangxiensis TaxID=1490290 RepID=A0A7W1WUP3_9BACL|nr:M42 family metallopeptidase [Paenactinomyces guangxiensis]MBA4496386.1 M42 family metallopeptidase [Paenactinomyces guangxiensis]MBH8593501.1 M42 family metallopeptidase [Paenactinomyces guangxiensis]
MIDWSMFEKLTQTPGAPGYEYEVRKVMRSYLSKYTDEIVQDRLGSIFGVKKGNESGPKVMVAGHMDEVAFMITQITSGGFLKFQTLGGWWSQVMLAQRVDVITRSGKRIPGVIGSIPPHLLSDEKKGKLVQPSQMFIDIGAKSDEQARVWGIKPGDFAVPHCPIVEMEGGERLMSKAWDNRLGCGIAIELLKDLQSVQHENIVYSGATVQEEVGLRGAATAANLIEPDICFAVDCGPAGDTPGVSEGFGEIGKGVLIRIYDRSMITMPGMRDFLLDTAESENIPYQIFVSQGGTDSGRVHVSGNGVPSATIGICARYIHSHAAIADKEDIEAVKAFAVALVKRLDRSTYESILNRL